MIVWLLAAHIVVLGYWLGSELVINSTYRLVSFADDMSFAERDRLMNHVMHVDQHVGEAGMGAVHLLEDIHMPAKWRHGCRHLILIEPHIKGDLGLDCQNVVVEIGL